MKRFFCIITAATAAIGLRAQQDSLIYHLQAIEVVATRPVSQASQISTTVGKDELMKNNYGFDVPSFLMNTPSVTVTSESGMGTGGASMRIRGTDATRINVTINGMPLNDPDSHAMYWYDTPDLAGSAGKIQVTRGAGTVTNGTGAFGGAVCISSAALCNSFTGDAGISYGSFNTSRQSVHIGSGLMGGKWIVDARLSHIHSDGYIDRSATEMKSYMLQAARTGHGSMLKFISFGGKTKTGLCYDGVTPEDMENYGPGYHTAGQYLTSDGPYVLKDGTHVNYFDDQTDNYLQLNNQLIYDRIMSNGWSFNAMLHYAYGNGYYRQYKDDAWLAGYNNLTGGWEQADLIRRKNMISNRWGINFNAVKTSEKLVLTTGISWMGYTCPHFGSIDWIDGMEGEKYEGFRWYDNDVTKHDGNIYAKADFKAAEGLTLHAELQYRLVRYRASGTNDNYDWSLGQMQAVSVDKTWHFFNPGINVDWKFLDHHNLNASFSMANKEPTRADFTDRYKFSRLTEEPKAERLYDWELSYRYSGNVVKAGVNLYWMQYKDQLVPTGIVNDSEDNLNVNADNSFRRGIELSLSAKPAEWFVLGADCTLSQNRIIDFDEIIGDKVFHYDWVDIAYSPSVISSAYARFAAKGFESAIRGKYISRQYISNGSHDDLSLPGYFTADIDLGYTLPEIIRGVRVRFGLRIANFTDTRYCSYGYGGSYMDGDSRKSWKYLFPQAPCNAIGNMLVSF